MARVTRRRGIVEVVEAVEVEVEVEGEVALALEEAVVFLPRVPFLLPFLAPFLAPLFERGAGGAGGAAWTGMGETSDESSSSTMTSCSWSGAGGGGQEVRGGRNTGRRRRDVSGPRTYLNHHCFPIDRFVVFTFLYIDDFLDYFDLFALIAADGPP